jgi:hypothetical protein
MAKIKSAFAGIKKIRTKNFPNLAVSPSGGRVAVTATNGIALSVKLVHQADLDMNPDVAKAVGPMPPAPKVVPDTVTGRFAIRLDPAQLMLLAQGIGAQHVTLFIKGDDPLTPIAVAGAHDEGFGVLMQSVSTDENKYNEWEANVASWKQGFNDQENK